jgi:hypothetical protein
MRRNFRFAVPFWIALVVAIPLIAIFALSLLAATAIAGVAAAIYFLLRPGTSTPIPRRRPARSDAIELDPHDYRRLPDDRSND